MNQLNARLGRITCLVALAAGCRPAVVAPAGTGSTTDSTETGGKGGGATAGAGGVFFLPDAGTSSDTPAGSNQCAEDIHSAEQVPLDLLLLVDTSGSMTDLAGTRTKWAMVEEALAAFLKDERSAGLGVGLSFFPLLSPDKDCKAENECPSAGALRTRCHERRVCMDAARAYIGAAECEVDKDCRAGTTCEPVGHCSMTGKDCVGVGQACPDGATGDTCMARSKVCRFTEVCEQPYGQPVVAIAALPGAAPALTRALEQRAPRAGTPMGPAVHGALAHLKTHAAANPGHRVVLVLATDGLPDGFCTRNFPDRIAEELAAAAAATPTYVIGVFSPEEVGTARPILDQLANAGGSGAPYVVMAAADLTQQFQHALDQIRGKALACEFTIPPPTMGAIDYGKVNLHVNGTALQEDVLYVGSAQRCDPTRGGWYYNVDPATGGEPTRVLVCDASCKRFNATAGSRVEVRYGCKTRIVE